MLVSRGLLQCAPGANFTPVLQMVDKVLAARKQLEAAGVKPGAQAAAKAAKGPPGQQQRQPGQPHPQQQKVSAAWVHMHLVLLGKRPWASRQDLFVLQHGVLLSSLSS